MEAEPASGRLTACMFGSSAPGPEWIPGPQARPRPWLSEELSLTETH